MASFSSTRLARIADVLESDVEAGTIPGAVVLVVRDGEIALESACGYRNRATAAKMETTTTFRIASMTKPVTSVVALALVEEGRLALADPVATYLPEFADIRVGTERARPARPMRVHDLLRHTSGLTYGQMGDTAIHAAYRSNAIGDPDETSAHFVAKLATIPLLYEPGTTWEYGVSTDVLGRIVEVVTGRALGEVFEERVFAPLGMTDTHFAIDDAEALAEADRGPGGRDPLAYLYDPARTARFEAGGAGLLSTARDYARFAATLDPGTERRGHPSLLSPAMLALMTADHLPPNCAYGPGARNFGVSSPVPENGQGFGLGLSVRVAAGRNPALGSVGDVCWSGISGTYFWVDPAERIVAIFLSAAPGPRLRYRELMRNLVYAALR